MDINMKYYPDTDILVIELGRKKVVDEELLDNDIVLGLDEEGKPVRIEIHNASRRGLANILYEYAKTRKELIKHIMKQTAI